jgi:phenylalanyl-tRNA synthetase beta chain
VAEAFELSGRVLVAEVRLDALLPQAALVRQFSPPPRFPSVDRDLAVFVAAGTPHAEVVRVIRQTGGDLLERADLFDVYEGPQAPSGHRSLAYALRFRAPDRTLTAEEVEAMMTRIRRALQEGLGGRMRE